jgi:hypothetical protein
MAKTRSPNPRKAAARAKGKAAKKTPTAPDAGETLTIAIGVPRSTLRLLRAVAFKRAQEQGGRPSVSALVAEIVERHRKELEKEAGAFLD